MRNHTATLLNNGTVLLTSGFASTAGATTDSDVPTDLAQFYEPGAGVFVPTGSMSTPRAFSTATLLTGGNVLIGGGRGTYEDAL